MISVLHHIQVLLGVCVLAVLMPKIVYSEGTNVTNCTFLEINDINETVEFSSVNYPEPYPPLSSDCWLIRSTSYDRPRIEIFAIEFAVQSASHCRKDWVEIRDGEQCAESLGFFCGFTSPFYDMISSDSYLYISFSSDDEDEQSGFKFLAQVTAKTRSVPALLRSWLLVYIVLILVAGIPIALIIHTCVDKLRRSRLLSQPEKYAVVETYVF